MKRTTKIKLVPVVGILILLALGYLLDTTLPPQKGNRFENSWKSFCRNEQSTRTDLGDFCHKNQGCVLVIGEMKRPCKSTETYSNGIQWFSQKDDRCSLYNSSLYWLKVDKNERREEIASAPGACDASQMEKLLQPKAQSNESDTQIVMRAIRGINKARYIFFGWGDGARVHSRRQVVFSERGVDTSRLLQNEMNDSDWETLGDQYDYYYELL